MFWHVFRYNLKADLRDRTMVFWTLVFPLILATLFGMAFANLDQTESFSRIPVAVVDNAAWQADSQLRTVMQQVSGGSDALFDMRVTGESAALQLLRDGMVTGVITPRSPASAANGTTGSQPGGSTAQPGGPTAQPGPGLVLPPATTFDITVTQTGLRPSIIKVFADEYQQVMATWRGVLTLDPAIDIAAVQRAGEKAWLADRPISSANPNTTLVYYYALIAMACLYGGFRGMKEIMEVQADQSPHAARVVISSAPRLQLVLASTAAKMVVQYLSLLLLILYLQAVLGIGFGSDLGRVLLACFLGSLLGIAIGAVIGVAFRASEGSKTGVLIGFSMLASMLAGLNNAEVKYMAVKRAPILAWINPANLIGDAFYALYYYETDARYWANILAMLAFIAVCGAFVTYKLRRQRYASL